MFHLLPLCQQAKKLIEVKLNKNSLLFQAQARYDFHLKKHDYTYVKKFAPNLSFA